MPATSITALRYAGNGQSITHDRKHQLRGARNALAATKRRNTSSPERRSQPVTGEFACAGVDEDGDPFLMPRHVFHSHGGGEGYVNVRKKCHIEAGLPVSVSARAG